MSRSRCQDAPQSAAVQAGGENQTRTAWDGAQTKRPTQLILELTSVGQSSTAQRTTAGLRPCLASRRKWVVCAFLALAPRFS